MTKALINPDHLAAAKATLNHDDYASFCVMVCDAAQGIAVEASDTKAYILFSALGVEAGMTVSRPKNEAKDNRQSTKQMKFAANGEKKFDKEAYNKVKESVERFIDTCPTLTDEDVAKYIDVYSGKIRGVYTREDWAESAVAKMKERVAAARQGKPQGKKITFMTFNAQPRTAKEIKPSDKVLETLPKPQMGNMFDVIIGYSQQANQLLVNCAKGQFAHLTEGYRKWYTNDLMSRYAPVLANERGVDVEQAKGLVAKWWNGCVRSEYTISVNEC